MYIFFRGLYWNLRVTVWMCPNNVWWIQSKVGGTYPFICWCMPYVHASSKVKEALCLNGYQWYTWWCVKWLLSFKTSLSYCLGMLQMFQTCLSTDPHLLIHSLDVGGIQWSRCRNCFWLYLLFLLTLSPCRFWFHIQDMILVRVLL